MCLAAGRGGLAGRGRLPARLLGPLLLLLLLARPGARALVCLPCDDSKCEEPRSCAGSIVQGVCGCCYMCARQRNESCGGAFGLHGACDRGLRCVIRPPLHGDSITEYEVGVCEDENWDDDQLLGFEPCKENLVSGCNIINGKCECVTVRNCNNPFEFPRKDLCLSALKRIQVFSVDCSTVECPSVQQAVCPLDSYETQVRLTADGCCTLPTRCECLSGLCGFPVCEAGSVPRIVSRGDGTPGKCCDVFECVNETKPACVFNNVEYSDGDMFRLDKCRFCRCQGGVAICFTAQCGALSCERYYVPEGECCPVCEDPVYPFNNPAGCYANGQILAHGDRWREDDCTFCQCINGEPHCVATVCGQSCMNPVKVPGECCPVCEEPTYITIDPPACGELSNCTLTDKDCVYGFKLDHNGCRACQCKSRQELCWGLLRGCTLDCPFGLLTDARGCEICRCRPRPRKCRPTSCDRSCPFGYLKNKHGCDICRCRKCPELPCNHTCLSGFQNDSRGCLTCRCREGAASPTSPALSGTCLSMDGHHHKNEESWHDGCRECYCHHGREMCALITCPVPACGSPTIRPGQCCPSCSDDLVEQKPELSAPSVCHAPGGEYFVEGETWNIDSCTQCTCHSGRVMCETEVCPPLLCQNPSRTQDSCCPQCTDAPLQPSPSRNDSEPSYCRNEEGAMFLAAESWKPDVCTSCVCMNSLISCFSESCPAVSCERPVLRKGQCCPYCIEDSIAKRVVCHFGGKAYADEERWDIDSCTHCYCLQGQTLCSTVSCPPLPCVEPINVEGSCCPICPEMYVPEPTNVPIEKVNRRGQTDVQVPRGPTPSENDIVHLRRDVGHLKVDYGDNNRRHPAAEESSLDSIAAVVVPVVIGLSIIIAFLLINQKKQWVPLLCWYRTPTKPSSLSNQLVSVDCRKGARAPGDGAQRMLRIAEPDARFSGFYSMQKQSHLQADKFYQTV
ncbi:cysteine-rich motor neuron 1 protein isoform X5 [Pipistrellus kuhlii]|uniref:cysteine-rich motor neuron 1 protein isoform X5 n=1 Tax=Pipistrellus kuhlii TaxID=59472 RepID=UPI001E2707FA|nr:cysteine-rich motor neuron 1 protein isoform X5 [Pipistrellus kuhlii]